ncbi:MAG: 3-phosphoshikimate 1-carboxyvinyltransferase [Nitrospirales bacterium]|nr:3-phosphoshikimate 1-carboxyvinyltransferase [Nitrospirales bacterium]
MSSLTITPPKGPLRGVLSLPGDKSITHRALILSALAEGAATVSGYCQGEDCLNTLRALQGLGIAIERQPDVLHISGQGRWGLREPTTHLDLGNSGTGFRLLTGVLASQDFFTVLTGDDSLRRRPMNRIVDPLREMGAKISGRKGGQFAPLALTGNRLKGVDYVAPLSSAQVKSAILLAGLFAEGTTCFTEPQLSRDHTERLFRYFEIPLEVQGKTLVLKAHQSFKAKDLCVPGDLSAAAFFLVAGTIVPGSELMLPNVGMNPARTGIIDILKDMGGDISVENVREVCGEPVADLVVRAASLKGMTIGRDRIPQTIDELPVLCVAAAFATGETRVTGAEELRVKETDRIRTMVTELKKLQVSIQETEDGFIIQGGATLFGGTCTSHGDHRVAMSVAIAALRADSSVQIDDTDCIETSFPGFQGNLLELLTNSC